MAHKHEYFSMNSIMRLRIKNKLLSSYYSLIKGEHATGNRHVHRHLCGHSTNQHLSIAGLAVMRRVIDRLPSPQLIFG